MSLPSIAAAILAACLLGLVPLRAASGQIDLILPTGNTAIFDGNDSAFYQRTASGRPEPWNGGRFGFVRNLRRTREGTIYTRYHEGVDIRPLYRDAKGRPLDSVVAIADGRVVHVNRKAGHSNYGRYIVVEHWWGGSPYYSLYAHLAEAWADSGADVRQGDLLGRMGYTGVGINKARAHLHLEIGLLLSESFQEWYDRTYNDGRNYHGCFNGRNLAGVDVERLYLALRDNPDLSMPEFLAAEQPYYEVLVPASERPGLLRRYPWMLDRSATPSGRSWSIAFTQYGLPLRVEPDEREVPEPRVFVLETSRLPYRWLTKSLVAGHGENYSLSESGRRYIDLMLMETRGQHAAYPEAARAPGDDEDEES